MKERIIRFERGPNFKKYKVILQNKKTKRIRSLTFGDKRYQQFRDRTPKKYYSRKNHGDKQRLKNYYSRHSGVKTRKAGIIKEKNKNRGLYSPKLLSHIYLW